MNYLLDYLKNLLFPKACYGCGAEGSYLCPKCLYSKSTITYHPRCFVCGKETYINLIHSDCKEKTYLDGVIHLSRFEPIIQDLIHDGKYEDCYDIFEDLAKPLAELLNKDYFTYLGNAVFCPVPSNYKKKMIRGFNQSDILAKNLSDLLRIEKVDLIDRVIQNESQTTKNRLERYEALRNTYQVKNNIILTYKKILLVDDVFTSGATLNSIAKILKEKGVTSVIGVCIARV